MKISYNWLKDFIDIDLEVENVENILTNLGLEVEGIHNFETIKGGLQGIIIGKVVECKKHPNADKLKLTKVNIGQKDPLQIVCGAPNVKKGQWVAVAPVGTTLYDNNNKPFKIKKGKIRGEYSFGMICAEDEIGLGTSHEGILVLKGDYSPGQLLNEIYASETDQVFEIGLTPNRADAMSHLGVARDLRAGLMQLGNSLSFHTPSISNFSIQERIKRIKIQIKDSQLAPRYCGVTISNIQVKESPSWLQNRLKAIGLKPKNNIVDITNYVMHELGQPLHAFDAAMIKESTIIVKKLDKETPFITLDGVERKLSTEDLMICDAEKPLCIAGVMGGENSGVTENTTSIFLESAYFNPVSIRKTAKRHAINSDASFRFERGIDPNITEYALKRAAILICELSGGKVSNVIDDIYPKKFEETQVFLAFNRINSLIGQKIDKNIIKSILSSLDIKVNNVSESGMGLTIPPYRVDVKREVDVIEEILRVYGYNNIELDQRFIISVAPISKFEDYKIQNVVASILVAQGFYETMSNSLTIDHTNHTSKYKESENINILNPLSNDLSVLRQSMLFSGLENISYNLNRKNNNLKFFEFGKIYKQKDKNLSESKRLSLFVVGNKTEENWTKANQVVDFFYLKGIVKNILRRLNICSISQPIEDDIFTEGITFIDKQKQIVNLGVVKQTITNSFGITTPVFFADFEWDILMDIITKSKTNKVKEIPKYPKTRRDFALLLDHEVTFKDIQDIAYQTERKILKEVNLFDVYQGDNLPENKKSYAVSFVFRDDNKTLTDKQVDKVMNKLQKQFEEQIQAELR